MGDGVKGLRHVEEDPGEARPLSHSNNLIKQSTDAEETHTGAEASLALRQLGDSTDPGGDETAVKTRVQGDDGDRPPVLSGPQILTPFRYQGRPLLLPSRSIDHTLEGDIKKNCQYISYFRVAIQAVFVIPSGRGTTLFLRHPSLP